MANYLVTGGAGFIGSSIVEHLVAQGEAVRVLDSMLTGKRENLAAVARKIEIAEGDLRDGEACARAAEDMDYVLHLGALPSVPRSIDSGKVPSGPGGRGPPWRRRSCRSTCTTGTR